MRVSWFVSRSGSNPGAEYVVDEASASAAEKTRRVGSRASEGVDAEVDTVGGVLVRARARGVAALVRGECQRVPVGFRVRVRSGSEG